MSRKLMLALSRIYWPLIKYSIVVDWFPLRVILNVNGLTCLFGSLTICTGRNFVEGIFRDLENRKTPVR